MHEMEERLKEVEESVRTVAKYVHDRISQTDKSPADVKIPKNLDRRLERIERNVDHSLKAAEEAETAAAQIEELKKNIGSAPVNVETVIQREFSRIDDRLRPLENNLSVAGKATLAADEIKKRMGSLESKMQSIIEENRANKEKYEKLGSKISDDFNRTEDLVYTSIRAASKETEQRVESRVNNLETLIHDSSKVLKDDIENKLKKELSNIEDILSDSGKTLTEKGMEKQIERMDKLKTNLERYVSVKVQLLESDIRDIKSSVSRITSQNTGEIKKRLEGMESELEIINEIKKELPNVKAGLGNIKSHVYDIEDKLSSTSEKEIQDLGKTVLRLSKSMSEWEKADTTRIEETRARFEESMKKLHNDFEEKVKKAYEALDDAEKKFLETHDMKEIQKMKNKIQKLDDMIEENFVGDKSVNKKISDVEHRLSYVNALREELAAARREFETKTSEINRHIEENFIGDSSVKKRLSSMESHIHGLDKLKKEVDALKHLDKEESDLARSVNHRFKRIDTDLKELHKLKKEVYALRNLNKEESELAKSVNRHFRQIDSKIREMKRSGAEDTHETKAIISSLGKRVREVEAKVHGIDKNVDFNRLMKEINETRKLIGAFESETKAKALSFVAKQLGEFAEAVDKRIPELVTKEAYLHDMAMLNHKIQSVEAPDVSYLNDRIVSLEDKIREISSMVHDMYNRLPVVVE